MLLDLHTKTKLLLTPTQRAMAHAATAHLSPADVARIGLEGVEHPTQADMSSQAAALQPASQRVSSAGAYAPSSARAPTSSSYGAATPPTVPTASRAAGGVEARTGLLDKMDDKQRLALAAVMAKRRGDKPAASSSTTPSATTAATAAATAAATSAPPIASSETAAKVVRSSATAGGPALPARPITA
ncbi:MAG: hypothetical protein EOO41_05850, partial [Methanobacteriota archaeon]